MGLSGKGAGPARPDGRRVLSRNVLVLVRTAIDMLRLSLDQEGPLGGAAAGREAEGVGSR